MRFRKQEPLFGVLLDTGLHLLDSLRERLPGNNVDDIKDRVRDTYDTASHRVSRATDALRGEEDSHLLGKISALLIGVGIGVGIGLLIAPASGEDTRADIADKVSDFGDKVRERTGKKPQSATGTHGE
jgi:YtxH-like protein